MFLTDIKNVSPHHDQYWAGQLVIIWCGNFYVAVSPNTISVINVKLCMMVLLIELCLIIPLFVTLTIFKVTAVSNSFNWKFYILIWWSLNFVLLLIISNRSWIYHNFWFSHMLRGDNWHITPFEKPLMLPFSRTLLNQDLSNFAGL